MFTGIVQKTSRAKRIREEKKGLRLIIENPFGSLEIGESIALDGACLTVERFDEGEIEFYLSYETLNRTKFSMIDLSSHLFNLERSLTPSSLMGGHIVLGHVDAVGRVLEVKPDREGREIVIEIPERFARYVVYKGSIAVDGVSLTVNRIEDNRIALYIIPHTMERTNLGLLKPESPVNLEFDIIAKYVERLMGAGS